MHFLKSVAIAGLALASLAGLSPATAQYFLPDGPPGYDRPEGDYPPPAWRRHREYRDYGRRYERPYYQPRARLGQTCATSRGACDLDDAQPIGSICKCYIPGFGRKRGYTQR